MRLPQAFPLLVAGLKAPDMIVRADTARLLGELALPDAVGPLVEYIKTESHYPKVAGFYALGQIGDRSAAAAIRPLVEKPRIRDDWYWYGCKAVRAAAALALLSLDDPSGVAFLQTLADIQEDVFFCWMAPAILRLSETPITAPLKSRLTVAEVLNPGIRGIRFSEPGVMVMAAETLGLLGGDSACAKLRELLAHHSRYVRGQAAVSLLAAAPTKAHRTRITRLAEEDPAGFTRIKAAYALARAGGPTAAILATATTKADNHFDRAVAIESLGLLGDPRYAPAVLPHVKHSDAYVRQCAVEALDRILTQTKRPSGKLLRFTTDGTLHRALLKDSSPRVRLQAAKFLASQSAHAKAST